MTDKDALMIILYAEIYQVKSQLEFSQSQFQYQHSHCLTSVELSSLILPSFQLHH